jgi:hypothetical protein
MMLQNNLMAQAILNYELCIMNFEKATPFQNSSTSCFLQA